MENSRRLLADKNFFLVVLSYEWSSLERMALCDAKVIIENGGQAYFYTYKDSPLDHKVKELGLTCFYHRGKISSSFFKWNKFKNILRLIRSYDIDLVHCYGIKPIWALCYFLKSKPLIPLLLTVNKELTRFYRGFWYQPLNRRIDQVLCHSASQSENLWGNLGIPPIKVASLGFGMNEGEGPEDDKRPAFRFSDDHWYLGTNLSGVEKEVEFLDHLFYALQVLVGKEIKGKKMIFVLMNEKAWNECLVTEELRRRIKDWGLEDHVAFTEKSNITDMQKYLDLWVSTKTDEILEDYAISALLNKVPCLLPRHHSSMELVREYGNLAMTYKIGDARSIRQMCEEMLKEHDNYKKVLEKRHDKLKKRFSFRHYSSSLAKNYHQLVKRRLRLMRSRKKVF